MDQLWSASWGSIRKGGRSIPQAQTDARPYLEAYCRLPIAALYRGYDKGTGTLVWRDAFSGTIGSAMVAARFDGTMHVDFDISGAGAADAFIGRIAISIRMLPAGLHRDEPYGACPSCDRSVKLLIAKEYRWRCGECHGLVNRASLLRTNTRLTEQVDLLESKIAFGRPRGMHNTTYERQLQRLAKAKAHLGSARLSADSRYTEIITHHLQGEKPVQLKKPRGPTGVDGEEHLFTGRLIILLNTTFGDAAYKVLGKPASQFKTDEELEAAIVRAARVRALALGIGDELVETSGPHRITRTLVEVPFLGEAKWLRVGSERGEPLPALMGQIDESASVIRFAWTGSVDDRPALRVQIDEKLTLLREYVVRQQLAVSEYNRTLQAETRRFLRFHRSGTARLPTKKRS